MIKERLVQVIELKGIAKEKFYKKIGSTSANFRGNARKTPLRSDIIENVLSEISDLSPEWLLTGKGAMLKTDTSNTEPLDTSEKVQYEEKIRLLENTLKDKEEIIKLLREQVDSLKKGDFDFSSCLDMLDMVAETSKEYAPNTQLKGEKTRKDYTKPHQ